MAVHRFELPRGVFPAAVVLFTLLPLAELALLVWLGGAVGVMPTLILCAGTGFLGAWLARAQGVETLLKAQRALEEGRFPGDEILDGAFLLAGGVVLLTPGLVTDMIGFALLLPPTRRLLKLFLSRWWQRQQGVIDISDS